MKKIVSILLISLMLSLAMGCGSSNSVKIQGDSQSATNHTDEEDVDNNTNQKVEVDEGLIDVEVTLPASFFSDLLEDLMRVILTLPPCNTPRYPLHCIEAENRVCLSSSMTPFHHVVSVGDRTALSTSLLVSLWRYNLSPSRLPSHLSCIEVPFY